MAHREDIGDLDVGDYVEIVDEPGIDKRAIGSRGYIKSIDYNPALPCPVEVSIDYSNGITGFRPGDLRVIRKTDKEAKA